ncbi:MAG: hypothetical protein ACFE8C_14165 [Promethearchaeota archaeon]
MNEKSKKIDAELDLDQKKVLFIYSLYSGEKELKFLQYTAILVICYYLMKQGLFPNYREQLLVYDYKNYRRYLWEDKKFMNDINVLRAQDTLIRARARSEQYRDVNSHQCSEIGHQYIKDINFANSTEGKEITKHLKCKFKRLKKVVLEDDGPYIRCNKCNSQVFVDGFLYDLHASIKYPYKPFFLSGDD